MIVRGLRPWAYLTWETFGLRKQGIVEARREWAGHSLTAHFKVVFIPREGLQYQDGEVWSLPREPAVRESSTNEASGTS
jgi:hypothetical protein